MAWVIEIIQILAYGFDLLSPLFSLWFLDIMWRRNNIAQGGALRKMLPPDTRGAMPIGIKGLQPLPLCVSAQAVAASRKQFVLYCAGDEASFRAPKYVQSTWSAWKTSGNSDPDCNVTWARETKYSATILSPFHAQANEYKAYLNLKIHSNIIFGKNTLLFLNIFFYWIFES